MSLLPLPETATVHAGPVIKRAAEDARSPSGKSFDDVLTKTPSLNGEQRPYTSTQDLEQHAAEEDDAQTTTDETLTKSGDIDVEADAPELGPETRLQNETAQPRQQVADPSETAFSSHLRQTTSEWAPAASRQSGNGDLSAKPVERETAYQKSEHPVERIPLDDRRHQTPPARITFGKAPSKPLAHAESMPSTAQSISVRANDGPRTAQAENPLQSGVTMLGAGESNNATFTTIEQRAAASSVDGPGGKQPIKTTLVDSIPVSEPRPHAAFEQSRQASQTTAPVNQGGAVPGSLHLIAAPSVTSEPAANRKTASPRMDGPERERAQTSQSVSASVPNAVPPGPQTLGPVAQLSGLPPNNPMVTTDRAGSDERADFLSSLSIEDTIALTGADTTRSMGAIGPDVVRAEMAKSVGAQLAEQMVRRAQGVVDVTLNPEELGRVKMAVNAGESTVSISIMAERPETLDLMRRHINQLVEEFRQMGFEGVELAFSDGAAAQDDTSGSPSSDGPWSISANSEMALETPDESPNRPGQQSGLDMRL